MKRMHLVVACVTNVGNLGSFGDADSEHCPKDTEKDRTNTILCTQCWKINGTPFKKNFGRQPKFIFIFRSIKRDEISIYFNFPEYQRDKGTAINYVDEDGEGGSCPNVNDTT